VSKNKSKKKGKERNEKMKKKIIIKIIRAKDIENILLVLSHSGIDQRVFELVHQIDFARVKQVY